MTVHDHDDEVRRWGECLTCTAAALTPAAPATATPGTGVPTPAPDFDGATYRRGDDHARLEGQVRRVYDVCQDGEWRTLEEIGRLTRDPEASVSARLRDLRKDKFGGHTVERRYRGSRAEGLYEYRLIPAGRLL